MFVKTDKANHLMHQPPFSHFVVDCTRNIAADIFCMKTELGEDPLLDLLALGSNICSGETLLVWYTICVVEQKRFFRLFNCVVDPLGRGIRSFVE